EFRDVTFSYDGKRSAVADLNFTALPGETVALVGGTGAGKSTALALLHRAFDPQSGKVQVDGINVRDLKLAALRHNIGVVFTESLMLNRPIADNLRISASVASGLPMRSFSAWYSRNRCCSIVRSPTTCASASRMPRSRRCAMLPHVRKRWSSSRTPRTASRRPEATVAGGCRGGSARVCRAHPPASSVRRSL